MFDAGDAVVRNGGEKGLGRLGQTPQREGFRARLRDNAGLGSSTASQGLFPAIMQRLWTTESPFRPSHLVAIFRMTLWDGWRVSYM